MTFAHPMLLAIGLGAIALPILIHILMRRRRRPMPWAAMRFLLEAYRRQRQRIRFEQWLLLAARCLIVLLAALAIARPMIPGADPLLGARATTLYLVLDNSLTAGHAQVPPTWSSTGLSLFSRLDAHKQLAYDLLDRLDEARGDRGAIYALAAPAHAVLAPPSPSVFTLGGGVARVARADSRADLHGALSLIAADIAQNNPDNARCVIAILSEFRAGSAPTDRPLPSLTDLGLDPARIVLAATPPAADSLANVAITALEPVRPIVLGDDAQSTMQVRLRARRSNPAATLPPRLPVTLSARRASAIIPLASTTLTFPDASPDAAIVIDLDPRAIADLRLAPSDPLVLEATIQTGDPLTRDNTRHAVIERRLALEVGLIAPPRFGPRPGVADYRAADWVHAALDPQNLRENASIRLRPIPPGAVDASTLASLQAVVVAEPQGISRDSWAALRRFSDLGGLILLFPQPGQGAQLWIDDAAQALALPWSLPREPLDTPATLTRPQTLPQLLAMIDGELADLLRPVTLQRTLPPDLHPDHRAQVLLALSDGHPALLAVSPDPDSGRGLVIYSSLALDLAWSDLPTKPLLVPLLQELVRQGVASARASGIQLAGDTPVAAPGSVELHWTPPPSTPEGAPPVVPLTPAAVARQPVRHAGLWRALDAAGADRGIVVVNPDTHASDTSTRSRDEIATWLQTAGIGPPLWLEGRATLSTASLASDADNRHDWPLLPILFALALALAIIEALAARFFSHASRAPDRPVAAL